MKHPYSREHQSDPIIINMGVPSYLKFKFYYDETEGCIYDALRQCYSVVVQ